ncbi:MAG: maltokinase N-terminal cap-like domain-containing protein [Acidimicrobiia bacterium]
MALFHRATITPTKAELIADWSPTRPWGPPADTPVDVIGSYRFDDPDGRVGMETHLVTAGDALLQVPLTYRDEPLDGADDALITEMQHSVLGTRWVYDGLGDPLFVTMLAAVAMTGQGEALGMAVYDGRWYIAPSNVRIQGGGWTQERVPVDGFALDADGRTEARLRNDRFDLTVFRRPAPGPRPPIGLTATWEGLAAPVVLAAVTQRSRSPAAVM